MQLLPAGVPLPFEVTYAPSLFVGMVILDYTTGEPVAVTGLEGQFGSVLPMFPDEVGSSLYVAEFAPVLGHVYVIKKNVYTDDTYAAVDSSGNYAQGSESFIGQNTVVQVLVQGLRVVVGCQQQPRQHPVVVAQNSDQVLLLSFFDECGKPIDIGSATGWALKFLESDNSTILIKSGGSITPVNGAINQILVNMVAADFDVLPPGDNDGQLLFVFEGENVAINLYACVSVQPQVA